MSSPPSAVLTSTVTAHPFTSQVGQKRTIGTSGVVGPATIKLQHRARRTDAWVDNPNFTFGAGDHLALVLDCVAVFNQIVVTGADGTTDVAVQL